MRTPTVTTRVRRPARRAAGRPVAVGDRVAVRPPPPRPAVGPPVVAAVRRRCRRRPRPFPAPPSRGHLFVAKDQVRQQHQREPVAANTSGSAQHLAAAGCSRRGRCPRSRGTSPRPAGPSTTVCSVPVSLERVGDRPVRPPRLRMPKTEPEIPRLPPGAIASPSSFTPQRPSSSSTVSTTAIGQERNVLQNTDDDHHEHRQQPEDEQALEEVASRSCVLAVMTATDGERRLRAQHAEPLARRCGRGRTRRSRRPGRTSASARTRKLIRLVSGSKLDRRETLARCSRLRTCTAIVDVYDCDVIVVPAPLDGDLELERRPSRPGAARSLTSASVERGTAASEPSRVCPSCVSTRCPRICMPMRPWRA